MKKKIIIALSMVMLSVFAITGCSEKKETEQKNNNVAEVKKRLVFCS